MVAAAFVLFALFYHPPEGIEAAILKLERVAFPYVALTLAGLVWALYNTALAMVFSFGPALLVQQGWSLTQAGSVTSLFMVLFSIALPIGGIVADRTGHKDAIIYLSLISFAALMPVILYVPSSALAVFCILGSLFALGAGPMMTLPGDVLTPRSRSLGMGVFFTIYYVVMMVGPRFGGGLAEAAGDAGMAILAGAGMSLAAAMCLLLFRRATV